jgi:hypothetical protein
VRHQITTDELRSLELLAEYERLCEAYRNALLDARRDNVQRQLDELSSRDGAR